MAKRTDGYREYVLETNEAYKSSKKRTPDANQTIKQEVLEALLKVLKNNVWGAFSIYPINRKGTNTNIIRGKIRPCESKSVYNKGNK